MDALTLFVCFIVGLIIGCALGGVFSHLQAAAKLAQLQAERAADADKLNWLDRAQVDMQRVFGALAFKTLKKSNELMAGQLHQQLKHHADQIAQIRNSFESNLAHVDQRMRRNAEEAGLQMNERLKVHSEQIGLMKSALQKELEELESHVRQLEITREGAYKSLTTYLTGLEKAQGELRVATEHLYNALKTAQVRGRWGEIQLRRIVELAGMVEHVSFEEQAAGADAGRPDLLVKLPNKGQVLVDAKCPLNHYLDAIAAGDNAEVRTKRMNDHARAVRQMVAQLSDRKYWEQFEYATELVILFVPIESCLVTAFEHDRDLLEYAAERRVILATPLTLLAFLRAVAYGWQQFTMSRNAKEILSQGKELYRRTITWLDHLREVEKKLNSLIDAHNKSVSSLNSRFLPAARRFQQLSALPDEIDDLAETTRGVSPAPAGNGELKDTDMAIAAVENPAGPAMPHHTQPDPIAGDRT